ncbi:UNVERIFIED_CONTAM: hypothetical protein FKN15_015424 [Acipenser sinensis]
MEGRRSAVQLQHSSPAESNQRGKHQGLLSPCSALWRAAREGSIKACSLPAQLCGEQPEREASGPAVSLLTSVESSQRGKYQGLL